jgi:hypothetical protein
MSNSNEQQPPDQPGYTYSWMAGELRIEIVENTVDLADLEPVVAAIQPGFAEVVIKRRTAGPAAGGPGTPEAALVLAFVIASHGFLQEFGKDLYAGFRAAVFAAYRRAKTWANARGYSPMTAERSDLRHVVFHFPPDMTEAAVDEALMAFFSFEDEGIERQDQQIARRGGRAWIVLKFEPESKTWRIEKLVG